MKRSCTWFVPTMSGVSRRTRNTRGSYQLRRNRDQAFLRRIQDGNRFNFPSYMDLSMRIELLAVMEYAAQGHLDYAFRSRTERSFNETDYEVLSALDENDASHHGASQERIDCLPISLLEGAEDEICSICLETPKEGELIRHLLCSHNFHQNAYNIHIKYGCRDLVV
eukprot:TRINITY_DN5826_c0_g1_i1.p1 TRINITY_DN5826_c0_g1~~TRINITY_DN5826_c0_g1_i1.p1  ORF type:complete len:167 (-),score=25.25 TRINITY_DN5826_c0_g1_i1:214-714(-)